MSAVTEQPVIAACSFCLKPNTEVQEAGGRAGGVHLRRAASALCAQLIDGPALADTPARRPGSMRSPSDEDLLAQPAPG